MPARRDEKPSGGRVKSNRAETGRPGRVHVHSLSLRGYSEAMKTITVSLDDELYQRADEKAVAEATSLSQVVPELLSEWTAEEDRAALLTEMRRLFQIADERDRLKEGSAGPFPREEFYAERLDRFH